MHLTDFDDTFLDLLENKPDDVLPSVGVVGDISRTWYVDKELMIDFFELCQKHNPEFHITQHGAHGFDLYSRDAAICTGVDVLSYGRHEADWKGRFDYKMDPKHLTAAAWFLLILPRRKAEGPLFERCYDVDPVVFETALGLDLPIYALSVDGEVKLVK